jgi:hypothetical protein
MSNAATDFEFIVTLRPTGKLEEVFTTKVMAKKDYEAKKKALETYADHEVLRAECSTPRWRREFGHAIISEKEIEVSGQKCLEVETPYAVVLVGPEDVYASISKTEREAMYWGIWAGKKYGRLRGHAAVWFGTQKHRVGRKTEVKCGSKTTRQTCGAEIYRHAATGVTSKMIEEKRQAEFRAREEAGRAKLQPRIDAGEFDPKNFEDYNTAWRAFGKAKRELGIMNGPYFNRLYSKVEAA